MTISGIGDNWLLQKLKNSLSRTFSGKSSRDNDNDETNAQTKGSPIPEKMGTRMQLLLPKERNKERKKEGGGGGGGHSTHSGSNLFNLNLNSSGFLTIFKFECHINCWFHDTNCVPYDNDTLIILTAP